MNAQPTTEPNRTAVGVTVFAAVLLGSVVGWAFMVFSSMGLNNGGARRILPGLVSGPGETRRSG